PGARPRRAGVDGRRHRAARRPLRGRRRAGERARRAHPAVVPGGDDERRGPAQRDRAQLLHLQRGAPGGADAGGGAGRRARLGLALACQTLAGYGMVRYLATTNTLLQLVVEDRYRGRMMGLHTVMFLGTQPLGSLVLGALAQRFGAPRAALVSGGVSLAAAGWLALRLRRVALRERAAAGAPGMPRPGVSTD